MGMIHVGVFRATLIDAPDAPPVVPPADAPAVGVEEPPEQPDAARAPAMAKATAASRHEVGLECDFIRAVTFHCLTV